MVAEMRGTAEGPHRTRNATSSNDPINDTTMLDIACKRQQQTGIKSIKKHSQHWRKSVEKVTKHGTQTLQSRILEPRPKGNTEVKHEQDTNKWILPATNKVKQDPSPVEPHQCAH